MTIFLYKEMSVNDAASWEIVLFSSTEDVSLWLLSFLYPPMVPWDLGLFCCIPTFVFLNIVCGGNFHLSRQQMWMRTKFSNRCRIRRWPNRLPFYSSNNSGHWASVGYTWYGFTNVIRHQLFVTEYVQCISDGYYRSISVLDHIMMYNFLYMHATY